jgi:hypothetical protein
MSVVYAAQLTAVATLALAVLALLAAALAGLAFWKQSQEVGLLLEQNRREAEDRRRAQAVMVYLWQDANLTGDQSLTGVRLSLRNTSNQPVYDLRIGWLLHGGFFTHARRPVLMPGADTRTELDYITGATTGKAAAVALFRDRAGVWWRTWTNGRYEEVDEPASETDPYREPSDGEPATETAPDVG